MNEAAYRKQHQIKEKPHQTNIWWFALELGFFAGIIWGGIRWAAYALHFTIVVPGFLVEPLFKHAFLESARGGWLGWGCFMLLSIVASLIYTLLLRKIPGPWAGMAYGVLWWAILFVGIGPLLKLMPMITKVTWNSVWTDMCLFLLWGLFIGYTVAIEFNDERLREPVSKPSSTVQGGQQGKDKSASDRKVGEFDNDPDQSQPEPAI